MSDVVWAIAMLVALCVAVIAVGGLLGFVRWALARLFSLIFASLRGLLGFLLAASRWLSSALQRAVAAFFVMIARALQRAGRAILVVLRDIGSGFRSGWHSKGAAKGTAKPEDKAGEPDDAADKGQESERDERSEERQEQRDPPPSAYQQALELLGLEGVEPLTSALLRQRYGEMIRILHPDKGFPNRVFAQQINVAVMTIKKAHGWR